MIHIQYSKEAEIQRIIHSLSRYDWYVQHGYQIYLRLPEGITPHSSLETISQKVEQAWESTSYRHSEGEMKQYFERIHEQLEEQLQHLALTIPSNINIQLTHYGMRRSYALPNKIIHNLHNPLGIKSMYHELIHLTIEENIRRFQITQWIKERIVDRILHTEELSFLNYNSWQKNYHGAEHLVDPLFEKYFRTEREIFWRKLRKQM